mgnify:FL=1
MICLRVSSLLKGMWVVKSFVGGDNLIFCGKGWYKPWEKKNCRFMVGGSTISALSKGVWN